MIQKTKYEKLVQTQSTQINEMKKELDQKAAQIQELIAQ